MRNQLLSISLAAVIGLGLSGAAKAASTPADVQTVPLQATNISTTMTFTKFDPNLGTLNSIDIFLAGHEEAGGTVNAITSDGTYVFGSGATIVLKKPNNSTIGVVLPGNSDSQALIAANIPPSYDYAQQTGDDSNTFTLTSGADLATFTGPAGSPGTIGLGFTAIGSSNISGPGTVTATISTSASGTGSVVYNYTPAATETPEPGAMAMLAAGGTMGAALLRRRRAVK